LLRTHTCGQLRAEHVGQRVTLCGWVDTYRDHSGVLFVDLRDRYGKTQVVFAPEGGQELLEQARSLRSEFVVAVTGRVAMRPEGTANPKLATGEVEVRAEKLELLNRSLTPPFQPSGKELPGEDVRLKYRYLDLRRPAMQEALLLRHRMIKVMRDYFDELGFIDVETPMLGRSTPEGARDFLVPSRLQPGTFYALPQSPQLYKQILMIAGYDRYVQIARCFRDEDLRADRQPEFTQLDLEMSFVEADDVMGVIDGLMARLAREILGLELELPLPRITYDEAMERFGHDAPDLRFGMELVDLTDLAEESEFRVFRAAAESGGRVRGLRAPGAAERYSRKAIDEPICGGTVRGSRAGMVQGGCRGQAQLTDRQELPARRARAHRPAHESGAGRHAVDRGRHVRGDLQGALRTAEDAFLLGGGISHVRLRRRGGTLDLDAPPVHCASAAGPRAARLGSRALSGPGL